uniref:Uncharacterized protein n=1 Tax=Caenorhabditis japonica TaxID=281687 RepID=A0A8R1E5D8_CAEJA
MQISNEITMITNLTLEILIMLVTISFLMIDCARKKTESKLSSSKAQVEPPKPVVPQQNNPVMTTDVLVERKSQVGNIPPVPPPRPESVPQQTEQNVEIEKKVSDANTRLASEEKKSKKKAKSVKKLAKQPSKIFKKRKRILAKDCPPMEKTQRLMSSRMFLFVFSFYFLSFKIASSPAADHRYAHRAFFEDHHVTNPNKIKYCGNIDVMKSNQKSFSTES